MPYFSVSTNLTRSATQVHDRGLAVGLKNDTKQVNDLVANFDFELSEECFEYQECDAYVPFIHAGKPVFEAEYTLALKAFCPQALQMSFSSILKHTKLDAYREGCQ